MKGLIKKCKWDFGNAEKKKKKRTRKMAREQNR